MGPRPFLVYLTFSVLIQYIYFGLVRKEIDPLVAQLGNTLTYFWYYGFIVASLLIFTGLVLLYKKFIGLVIQRIGITIMALLSITNALIIMVKLDVTDPHIAYFVFSLLTFAIACAVHFWDVSRYMKRVALIVHEVEGDA
jgi:hypothetical protein